METNYCHVLAYKTTKYFSVRPRFKSALITRMRYFDNDQKGKATHTCTENDDLG